MIARPDPGARRADGRVVPVYAVTGGRTRSTSAELPLDALVTATDLARRRVGDLQHEYRTIVELAAVPVALAEVALTLTVPVGAARVLVSDLAGAGYLNVHEPRAQDRPDAAVLERLLHGLRSR